MTSGSGGLTWPTGMVISPAGTLLVASRDTNEVLEYNASTGGFLGAFVSAGSGGLTAPFGVAWKPPASPSWPRRVPDWRMASTMKACPWARPSSRRCWKGIRRLSDRTMTLQ